MATSIKHKSDANGHLKDGEVIINKSYHKASSFDNDDYADYEEIK